MSLIIMKTGFLSRRHGPRLLAFSGALTGALSISWAQSAPGAATPAQASPATLPDTVVTATRFPESARNLPMGVDVITAEQIEASGVSTVNEALMRLLGIVGRQDLNGGDNYQLDLRGFGATADVNQAIIVDGVRINEQDLGGTRLAGIPIESVERIELLHGSGSVLYGEGATAGTIIITTRAGANRERANSASVYAGVGTYGTREARASATVSSGGFSLDMSGAKRKTNNFRHNFKSDFNALSATGQWTNDWLRVGLSHAWDSLDTGLPGALTAAEYAANPRQTTSPQDHGKIDNRRTTAFARASLGNWELAADLGHREKRARSVYSGFRSDYDINADSYALRARHTLSVSGFDNVLVVGSDYSRWKRDALGSGAHSKSRSHAFYIKNDLTLPHSHTRLSAGARTERIRRSSDDPFATTGGVSDRVNAWELGLSQPLGAAWTAYARAGKSFRVANADEFTYTDPAVALKPQTSRDTELGVRWTTASAAVDVRLYRSELKNEIGFDPNGVGPFGPFGSNINFDPTRREGLELSARYAVNKSLELSANAALRRSTFRAGPYAGREVPLAPRRTLSLRADWKIAPAHSLTGGINWVSSQRPDFGNQCRMPNYATADLRYAYQWHDTELAVGVSNLFDRKYYTSAFGCAGGVTTSIYPESGRTVMVTLRHRF